MIVLELTRHVTSTPIKFRKDGPVVERAPVMFPRKRNVLCDRHMNTKIPCL